MEKHLRIKKQEHEMIGRENFQVAEAWRYKPR